MSSDIVLSRHEGRNSLDPSWSRWKRTWQVTRCLLLILDQCFQLSNIYFLGHTIPRGTLNGGRHFWFLRRTANTSCLTRQKRKRAGTKTRSVQKQLQKLLKPIKKGEPMAHPF